MFESYLQKWLCSPRRAEDAGGPGHIAVQAEAEGVQRHVANVASRRDGDVQCLMASCHRLAVCTCATPQRLILEESLSPQETAEAWTKLLGWHSLSTRHTGKLITRKLTL